MLTATAAAPDPFGAAVALSYVWKVNGVVKRTVSSTSATTDSFDLGVPGNGDDGDTITVEVTPANGRSFAVTGSATATVPNDPKVTVNDPIVAETASGQTVATFTVSLDRPTTGWVSMAYTTANLTATAPGDYTATSGEVIFEPYDTMETITVLVVGDTVTEADERFKLVLSPPPSNAELLDGEGIATITNDDVRPFLFVSDARALEGNSGTRAMSFTVTLSQAVSSNVTVRVATADSTAGRAATTPRCRRHRSRSAPARSARRSSST